MGNALTENFDLHAASGGDPENEPRFKTGDAVLIFREEEWDEADAPPLVANGVILEIDEDEGALSYLIRYEDPDARRKKGAPPEMTEDWFWPEEIQPPIKVRKPYAAPVPGT